MKETVARREIYLERRRKRNFKRLSSVEFSRAELPLIRWSGIGTKPMRTNFHRAADVI